MSSAAIATALLTVVVLLVPATIALFTVGEARRADVVTTPARSVMAATTVALGALAVAALLDAGPGAAATIAVLLGASVLAWTPVARPWAARGLVAWALVIDAAVLYLAYVLHWTVTADLSVAGLLAAVLLLALEAFVLLIGAGFAWELVDVLARRQWSGDVVEHHPDGARQPFVSLHVPTHNEPPDLVIATLTALTALDYDDYEVIVVDNNTDDPALWQPVEAWCQLHPRFSFLHLADWPGYKSGALNEALRHTDPRAEVVGIVDADYLVAPDFLAECAPLLTAPGVVFVQTPQDYRAWDISPYFRRLYRSYAYFFDVSQRSRAERNGAIFGGTMGLIRRDALAGVGGWDEWCITEDAELSLRLLRAGGRGVHVDRAFGQGLMPLTFEALKRQRFRWCFGGIQILRMHVRSLLPGRRTANNQLNLAQRWAYLVGGLQWFGDLASVLFTGFLLLGAFDLVTGSGLVVRRMSGLLLTCVLVLVVLGALRSIAVVRRTSGSGWGEALGAFGIWLALGWTVALGAFRGLFARQGAFLRTPKVKGEIGWRDAVRGNRVELLLGVVCAVTAVLVVSSRPGASAAVLSALLCLHAVGYLAAPVNSLAAITADLPEELRRRRREALVSWGSTNARRGGFVLVATAGLVTVALFGLAAPVRVPDLPSIGDRIGERGRADLPAEDPTSGPPDGATQVATDQRSTVPATTADISVAPRDGSIAPPTAGRTPTLAPTAAPTTRPGTTPPGATRTPTTRPTPTAKPTRTRQTGRPTDRTSPTRPTQGGRP